MDKFSCISYYSYIKPQHSQIWRIGVRVVYRTIPTSNHNCWAGVSLSSTVVYRTIPTSNHNVRTDKRAPLRLYIVLFLHQTTTDADIKRYQLKLYIVLFLHQTTTLAELRSAKTSCISYYSYIKPQQHPLGTCFRLVVYRTIPTSNHNYSLDIK